ncbi:protein LURP-one-related 5-like [Panicum miliaceum]|uniref:Protein LURP-one-related 5-like n=1 Tax=Panicum miliaceum TaxID=4540 RepID=A0A3L6Q4E1_PANMI|nr:protein LURP-one-related 5-like [Panicum miliaceum]
MHPAPPRSSPSNIATGKRVHPSDADALHHGCPAAADQQPALYTVWKRSSMGFQGTDGFSVYDAAGALAFRVDNYSRRRKFFAGELLLMDGQGAPLLALRPQILSMCDHWNCYRAPEEAGDKSSSRGQHLFSMRKCSLVKSNDEAEVHVSGCTASSDHDSQAPSFMVQGSFWRRSCKIQKGSGEEVARITRKKAGAVSETVTLDEDVFSLTIMPNVDRSMIMAIVVILDRICQRPYKPLICSS